MALQALLSAGLASEAKSEAMASCATLLRTVLSVAVCLTACLSAASVFVTTRIQFKHRQGLFHGHEQQDRDVKVQGGL